MEFGSSHQESSIVIFSAGVKELTEEMMLELGFKR
jgi:hypothetical protein